MAFFGVTVETIERVWQHPQADRLELAKAKGLAFQFVIPKGVYAVDDKILYFPLDSQLPASLIEKLNMVGKFAGKDKNRVKTMKLRGEISQGYVTSPKGILPDEMLSASSEEITSFLGVTKYEPPVNVVNDAILVGLPIGLSSYDIEGADRNQEIVDLLLNKDVVVMEKMEGTNASFCKDEKGNFYVNQRNNSILEKEGVENTFWKVARNLRLLDLTKALRAKEVAIYAELCGPKIQNNIYELKDHITYIFDIFSDRKWVPFEEFASFLKENNFDKFMAPVVFKGKLKDFLGGKTIQEVSNGPSLVNSKTLREGIVVKPLVEEYHQKIGRLIIKQRSPEYLSKTEN